MFCVLLRCVLLGLLYGICVVSDVVTNTEYREAHKTLPIHRISNWNSAVIASGRISPEVCECELGSLKLMFERTSASQIMHIIGISLDVCAFRLAATTSIVKPS